GARAATGEWTAYGGDAQGTRWSPLDLITRDNVGRLEVAWTASTGEGSLPVAAHDRFSLETTPLVVDGTMYVTTPLGRVLALDPATGERRWAYDPGVDQSLRFGDFTNRGVATWLDSAAAAGAPCRRTIFAPVIDARVVALDAATGAPCARFGERGTVDLRRGLRNAPEEVTEYELTSPPTVVNGVVVVGSAVADNNRADAASGEVRGYDARTGALRWTFHPVPQDSADPAFHGWQGPNARRTGAANAWTVFAADPERDLVFVPTASPSPDYYGGERLGDNRYASSLVALRASTGQIVWHFQTVHHDVWDYDNAAPPALVTLRRDGRDVPAVLQATKTGQLFVLHRETGAPLFPVEERPVPASDVAGEHASPTQPFSALPQLGRARLDASEAWGLTDADRVACRDLVAGLRNEGIFTPPSLRGTLVTPSNVGGAHWGGVAVDVERRIAVIPVNHLAAVVQLLPRAAFDSMRARVPRGERLDNEWEYGRMLGTPYAMRRRILLSPGGVPCTPPPFGTLAAIDLDTGRKLWEVPLGTIGGIVPEEVVRSVPGSGSPNLGGPIVTAGGLVFVGASVDRSLRAFDVETGRELWRGELPAGAKATPMTYRVGGRQYVTVAAGGGGLWGKGDRIVTFSLPATTER
ncbi:MAG TPA: pyrroloquinoline quinone-dependent dehydrogenase, partial [Gemmatimonadaceae bacterium]|nr:pyrroloquinoline quinone-dependent dehydrogenase [Gemmatimonadaceae bacterium]